ncbi:MAG: DnaJ-class molecular chaperone with C-terminal Zn finger domain [Bacteroidota bacterium]|jgi:hypothetical protein|nr:DnaJ-class molecular chaperone with C-terminal Zn finger domain [Bacteroidota bacterium]
MADYYSILGLPKNATEIEIKTAFRKLAKVYHPDKNPNDPRAKDLFEVILKAYNTLINPHSRRRYDLSQTAEPLFNSRTHQPKQKGQKEWSTTDEDIRRREYYRKHYQQVKTKTATSQIENAKTRHTDYKYVLFATPIAVGLLMLIVSIFGSKPGATLSPQTNTPIHAVAEPIVELTNGDKPYTKYFGSNKLFDTPHSLKINNSSSNDAVIVVYDKLTQKHIQHTYLKNGFSAEFTGLPETGVYWKSVIGTNWSNTKPVNEDRVTGSFNNLVQYQSYEKAPVLFPKNQEEVYLLYVIDPSSPQKNFISNEHDFFKK